MLPSSPIFYVDGDRLVVGTFVVIAKDILEREVTPRILYFPGVSPISKVQSSLAGVGER